jgi:inosine-uridine nucleoside N-ribohydrolase
MMNFNYILGIGNIVSSAEFNFWADPEAAYVVLNTKFLKPINLVPWETCRLEAKFDLVSII